MVALVVWAAVCVITVGMLKDNNAISIRAANRLAARRLLWVIIFSSGYSFVDVFVYIHLSGANGEKIFFLFVDQVPMPANPEF
jgi:hypothetical protein